jgi:hypothetical protein
MAGASGHYALMPQRVIMIDPVHEWEPNDPGARLVATDGGDARLTLRSHPNDDDERDVVFVWSGCRLAQMGGPNDEAIEGHRLWDCGLASVSWLGEVVDSELIASLERQNRVHPRHDPRRFSDLRHWVVLTKETVVEVVATSWIQERAH